MESSGPAIVPAYDRPHVADPGAKKSPPPQSEIVEKLWVLWRNRAFLLHLAWITAAVSTIVAFLLPVRYESVAALVPGETSSSASMMAGLLNKSGAESSSLALDAAGMMGLKTPGAFYVEVLQSRKVEDRLIDRFDLRKHYGKKYYQDARKKLASYTTVAEDKKSGIITVAFRDTDKQLAAAVVSAYVEEVNKVASELNTSAAHREREFLEDRLKSAKQELDQASLELSQFTGKHTMIDVQQQGKSMVDAAARLEGEMIAAQSELKSLLQVYAEDNVRVRTLRARIGEYQAQLKRLAGNYTEPAQAAAAKGSDGYPSIRNLSALGYLYQDLYRRAKIDEAVFESLTQQYEAARVQEAKELPVVRTMDEGVVAEKKVSPIRSLIIGLSLLTAFVLGCFWVLEKDRWNRLAPDDRRKLLAGEIGVETRSLISKLTGQRVGRNRYF